MKRYKYTKLIKLGPVDGFLIHTPDDRKLKDTHPQTIVKKLNQMTDRIKRLEEDSKRLNWLLNRGLAWRECYNECWKEGEWLYASQNALETIDKAKEAK